MYVKFIQSAMVVLEKLLAVLVAVMVLLVFANVMTRYIFHISIAWSEEIARFSFIFLVVIGAVIALERDEHLNIQIFEHFKSEALVRFFKGVSLLIVAVALGIFVSGGVQLVMIGMRHPAPVTGIPLGLVYLVVVASMAMMLAIVIVKFFILLRGDK